MMRDHALFVCRSVEQPVVLVVGLRRRFVSEARPVRNGGGGLQVLVNQTQGSSRVRKASTPATAQPKTRLTRVCVVPVDDARDPLAIDIREKVRQG
jgi:hypothetical protein